MAAARILIVDDDQSIRTIVHLCLTDEGYEVIEAANGQLALEALDGFQPDLILLDLRMPVMDGREFVRIYRGLPGPHAPVVAFAATVNIEAEYADLDSDGILAKPFDLEELIDAVRSRLPLVR